MAYYIPLRYIPISKKRSDNRQFDVSIPATRIVAIMSTEINQARKAITRERKNGTLINGSGLEKAKSAIFLDNGTVVSSPFTVKRLMNLIDRAGEKGTARVDKRIRVTDVYEDDLDEYDDSNEVEDLGAVYDDDDFDDDDYE